MDVVEEKIRVLAARGSTWLVAFSLLEPTAQIEIFCLTSFAVCLLGSLGSFPLAANLAVALLGLICCRSGSDAQCFGYVLFAGMTTVTDIAFLCGEGTTWGVLLTLTNLLPKLCAASHCFRICSLLGGGGLSYADDPLSAGLAGQDYHHVATAGGELASLHQTRDTCRAGGRGCAAQRRASDDADRGGASPHRDLRSHAGGAAGEVGATTSYSAL